jgi:hypothetical protein
VGGRAREDLGNANQIKCKRTAVMSDLDIGLSNKSPTILAAAAVNPIKKLDMHDSTEAVPKHVKGRQLSSDNVAGQLVDMGSKAEQQKKGVSPGRRYSTSAAAISGLVDIADAAATNLVPGVLDSGRRS